MNTHRITGALAALVVAGALVSCAADAEPPASGAREGKGKAAAQKQRDDRKSVDKKRAAGSGQAKPGKGRGQGSGAGPAAPEQGGSAGSTGAGEGTSNDPTNDGPAARPSCADDPSGDLESSGDAPSYADVTGGCLRADGTQLRLEARTVEPVPARMPDRDTQLAYGFELTTASGSTTYVHAQASPEGWKAFVSRGESRREIAPPTVGGSRVVLTLPLAELGAGSIQWTLEASWLESSLLGTAYAFDGAPNGGAVRFDR